MSPAGESHCYWLVPLLSETEWCQNCRQWHGSARPEDTVNSKSDRFSLFNPPFLESLRCLFIIGRLLDSDRFLEPIDCNISTTPESLSIPLETCWRTMYVKRRHC